MKREIKYILNEDEITCIGNIRRVCADIAVILSNQETFTKEQLLEQMQRFDQELKHALNKLNIQEDPVKSIGIKNMDMPDQCWECDLTHELPMSGALCLKPHNLKKGETVQKLHHKLLSIRKILEPHYLIIGHYTNTPIGCCCGKRSKKDVLAEEPLSTFQRIRKKDCPICNETDNIDAPVTQETESPAPSMTIEQAIYCLKADSDRYPTACKNCEWYHSDNKYCFEDANDLGIKALEYIKQKGIPLT